MSVLENLPLEIAKRRVLPTRAAAEFIGQTVSNFRHMLSRGELPAPIRLSERRLGFRIGDLMNLIDCRERGRAWKDCRGASVTGGTA